MSELHSLSLGYSPCPNDTYIFYALVHGLISGTLSHFGEPVLDDVETLNRWALEKKLDVTKLSFHALGHVLQDYSLLRTGAALGRGCGPMLITGPQAKKTDIKDWEIAIPGRYTTAAMLLQLYNPECTGLRVMRFEEIIDAVRKGEVDGGVIIHESRFTYQQYGLQCVQDLGEWWEQITGLPIPLGCIAAKRSLPFELVEEVEKAIGSSLQWAITHPDGCAEYIRQYAQELEDEVVNSHVGLYVNDFSLDLGEEGVAAVEELFYRGIEAGVFPGLQGKEWNLFRN